MAWKLRYQLVLLIILYMVRSSTSSCSKKDKFSILLNTANEFISKAKDSNPECSHGLYSSHFTGMGASSLFMNTATNLLLAAKRELFPKSQNSKYKVVCYFDSWAYLRKGESKFDVSGFLPNLCTHAIYGLAKLDNNKIESSYPLRDLPGSFNGYIQFNDLKQRNPNLKTLIGIGGWDMGSAPFSFMAADKSNRVIFIESVVAFLQEYGFDGLDIDWAYPASNGGRPEDKQNFVILLRELRAALHPRELLLTITVSATIFVVDLAYDIPEISKELDQIHLLSFDFYGSWNNNTGFNAPLYAPKEASEEVKESTVDFAVNYWLEGGAPKEKLVLGLPLFGRTFTLASPAENGVRAPATGPGKAGPLNGGDEEHGFNEICDNLTKRRWASVWDPDALTPYAYKGNQWVSYDDQRSLNAKVDYLIKKGLAGALLRSIDTDDYMGRCYGKKYYLLKSVASKLLM